MCVEESIHCDKKLIVSKKHETIFYESTVYNRLCEIINNMSVFATRHKSKKKQKSKKNRNGLGYMKSSVSGTILKIIRINIRGRVNGDDDEQEAFRLNELNGVNQNKTRLKASSPGFIIFLKEETLQEEWIKSSKEEYVNMYYGLSGKQIREGDSVKFHLKSVVAGTVINDKDVEGVVAKISTFLFTLQGHRFSYMYNDCTNIKVKENGFFVDGHFIKFN